MDWKNRNIHMSTAAALHVLYAIFHFGVPLLGAVAFAVLGLAFAFLGASESETVLVGFGVVFVALAALLAVASLVPAILHIVAAVAMVTFPDEYATNILAILMAAFALPVMPFGTIIGMHTFMAVGWDYLMDAHQARTETG